MLEWPISIKKLINSKDTQMAKKLSELIDLNKIQNAWEQYLEKRNEDKEDSLFESLTVLERCVLEALITDFNKKIDYY
jgi:hypothetical protein